MGFVLHDRFGLDPSKTIRILLGVPRTDPVVQRDRDLEKERMGAASHNFIFFSPRACRPLYNIHLLIEGFKRAAPNMKDAQLWTLEFGADPGYLNRIKKQVAGCDPDISSRIRFLPPSDPRHLEVRIASADVIVSIPDSDGMPVTLMQSLALGKPILYRRLPQLEELADEGIQGYGIDENNPEKIQHAMENFYNRRSELGRMKDACLQKFKSLPDPEAVVRTILEVYEHLVKAGRR
jgi:glycosyltransferase involved in cell wall biosynthesis